MTQETALPVLSYATGEGWSVLGQANTLRAARRIAQAALPDSAKLLIDRCGFQLQVFRRSELQVELNGGPAGYVWSVGK